ncbi:MAG: calcium-binding protein [Chloroflexi bacterium]|nr:calcium-binding protein [Chloroflexota bacterium]
MADTRQDETRERRIAEEIVVDAYGEEERALGWYYYLEDRLTFPFLAKCTSQRRVSLLKRGEVVEVIGMAPEDDCMHDMIVMVRWSSRTFGVPLAQLEGVSVDGQTQAAMEDWRYWVATGNQF